MDTLSGLSHAQQSPDKGLSAFHLALQDCVAALSKPIHRALRSPPCPYIRMGRCIVIRCPGTDAKIDTTQFRYWAFSDLLL